MGRKSSIPLMNMQEQEQTLIVQPDKALYIFGGIGIFVVILSLIGQYISSPQNLSGIHFPFQADIIQDYTIEFDFNGKPDIAIYYNVLILEVASLLLFIISYLKNIAEDKYRFQWSVMAWIVLGLSIDNLAVVHKKINEYLQSWTNHLGGWFEYKWVIAGIVVFVILAILFFQFWKHLDNKYKILFFVFVITYFGGALGKEYSLFIALDQILQYGSVTLLIYSLLLYIKSEYSYFSVSIRDVTDISRNAQQDIK